MCCCTQHVNIDYVRTKLNELFRISDQPLISDNETLVSETVYRSDNIDCIERLCKNCSVNMLKEIEANIKCCRHDCKHNDELCDSHTIVFHQFKQSNYKKKKGETKNNLGLVTDRCTINALLETLKELMETFPRHRFNNCQTESVYREAINALTPRQLVKVQDFSENYTCVVPDEVQSLHWAQAQVTIFPVVTFRRDEDKNLIEDHLVFLSDDKIHDSSFVELVNNKIHE